MYFKLRISRIYIELKKICSNNSFTDTIALWTSVNIGSGNGDGGLFQRELIISGSGNGLAPNRHQATGIWSNFDTDLGRHMPSLGHNELTHWGLAMP